VPEDSPVLEKIGKNFQTKNVLRVKIKKLGGYFSRPKRLKKYIRQNQIEIVHAHAAKDYLPVSLAVRFAPQTKLILTRHVLFSMKRTQKFSLGNVAKVIAVSSAVEANLGKTFRRKKSSKFRTASKSENGLMPIKTRFFENSVFCITFRLTRS